jgi:hypothetical protein
MARSVYGGRVRVESAIIVSLNDDLKQLQSKGGKGRVVQRPTQPADASPVPAIAVIREAGILDCATVLFLTAAPYTPRTNFPCLAVPALAAKSRIVGLVRIAQVFDGRRTWFA